MSELIDNRAHRVRTLKDIIKRLHGGESPDTVRGALRDIVQQTDYSEIVEMEQQDQCGTDASGQKGPALHQRPDRSHHGWRECGICLCR